MRRVWLEVTMSMDDVRGQDMTSDVISGLHEFKDQRCRQTSCSRNDYE